ncbi:double-strand break repair protein mus-23 [Phyllosticta citricarpa]|uniref:Double-strand break repair protein n=1 Tax=Phyllosticta citricarpa TaxID=55181 RepID=A0ABR1MHB2_9PEZI
MPGQSQNRRDQSQGTDHHDPDTIRMLVATDNHVGYHERDAIRGDDSWKSFHEIMTIAKERDVDMVLLAGDLFHENKPSRKSMYQVMRTLRMACLGDKPCELEMLSDASEHFAGTFDHVNYEDPDINVAIPVFSIHGNHDDPSGEGHLAALDLLQVSGLVNYYGRTPESDKIQIKPLLLQKGRTKLALYGMSNVRDERLFRTFRDGNVKFFRPSTQQDEWFNLMSVHQNHHAHTFTDYLPENFLPEFLDMVIWGHEHECLIEPKLNPEMGFHVMQPGSSVATSLMPGEAEPKHVAILSIKGKDFECEPIRLKTVRPFVMKEIVLADESAMKGVWKKDNNRPIITRHLIGIVEELIEQAKAEWLETQGSALDEDEEMPLPLVRLRVNYSSPDGGKFDCENPQRFSNRFVGKVANIQDVVQFHRGKAKPQKKSKNEFVAPDENVLARLALDNVKVEKLVREYLTAQSLTILPQNSFGDAVAQFVDKDDKYAMETFVNESLASQMKHLLTNDEEMDEVAIKEAMDTYRAKLEELFAAGHVRPTTSGRKVKPKPDNWDSDMDGHWADQPGAMIHDDDTPMDDDDDSRLGSVPPKPAATRGRGRGRGRGGRGAASSTSRTNTAAAKKAPAKGGRGRRARSPTPEDDGEDDDQDVIMISDGKDDDDDDDDESDAEDLFTRPTRKPPAAASSSRKAPESTTRTRKAASPAKKAPTTTSTRSSRAPASSSKRQTQLNFSQAESVVGASQRGRGASSREVVDEIEDDDEEDAFEPPAPRSGRRR